MTISCGRGGFPHPVFRRSRGKRNRMKNEGQEVKAEKNPLSILISLVCFFIICLIDFEPCSRSAFKVQGSRLKNSTLKKLKG